MMLDATLWEALEAHGVTTAHLDMLLRLLETQRNGAWTWQVVNGHLTQCDIRLVFPARGREVAKLTETLFEGNGPFR